MAYKNSAVQIPIKMISLKTTAKNDLIKPIPHARLDSDGSRSVHKILAKKFTREVCF
jgi:hypothetical protein